MLQVVDVTPTNAVEKAGWIAGRLHDFEAFDAGSVIPSGFAAYARIDHEREGVLPPAVAQALVKVLLRHTKVPETPLWLAIWDGYGEMNGPPAIVELRAVNPRGPVQKPGPVPGFIHPPRRARNAPRVKLPHRDYLLYRGRPDQVAGWMDGPNLWWPDDRAWFVASEIDLPWTYVGGSTALIEDMLADRELNARPLSLDESTMASDHPELGERA